MRGYDIYLDSIYDGLDFINIICNPCARSSSSVVEKAEALELELRDYLVKRCKIVGVDPDPRYIITMTCRTTSY